MEEEINIEFQHLDFYPREMQYIRKKINKISDLVNKNPRLIEILSDFLLSFLDKTDFNKKFKIFVKKVKTTEELYGSENLKELLNELENSYKALKVYDIDKFRGLVFEQIMEKHYKKEVYNKDNDKFGSGCQVILNEKEIEYIDESNKENNRKTVDIAGYNPIKSEFYEIKVGPKGFKQNVIRYLNMLNYEVNSSEISDNIITGCVTLKKLSALKLKLKSTKEDFSKLNLSGYEEVKKILMNK